MTLTQYTFRTSIAGFFEIPTADAHAILPVGIEPLERNYGCSILLINVYDFTESEVGAYKEIVYGIMVPPRFAGSAVPAGAAFPCRVATNTRESREHAIQKWHLPHWPADVSIDIKESSEIVRAEVCSEGSLAIRISVKAYKWQPMSEFYQTFMQDNDGSFMTTISYEGEKSEHENEQGKLFLVADHPFNSQLPVDEIFPVPFREMWLRGVQKFQPLRYLE